MGGVEFLIQALSKQYVELQRAVTLKPGPLIYTTNVHLIDIKAHAQFDEFPYLTFKDKEKPKRYGRMERLTERRTKRRTDKKTDGWTT